MTCPQRTLRILAPFAAFMLFGCSDLMMPGSSNTVPGLESGLAPDPERASAIAARAHSGAPIDGPDEMGSFLNAAVPGGIGGVFIGHDGRLKVYIKDLTRQEDARTQLVALQSAASGESLRFPESRIDFLQGSYDWDELRDWLRMLFSYPLPASLHEIDIDESENRLRFVLSDPAEESLLRSTLSDAGVPQEAVLIEIEEPAVLALLTSPDSLTQEDNPIRAGFQIHGGEGLCTLTANTKFDSTEGFITVAHCTEQAGEVGPDVAFQGSRIVADEVNDPEFFSSAEVPGCPSSSYICRYSDAAMFEYRSDTLPQHGIIAGAEWGNPVLETPDLSIEDDDPHCPWVPWCTFEGDSLYKIGARTGLTDGVVDEVCVKKKPGPYWWMCSDRVDGDNGIAGAGDSGAPVFEFESAGNVTLWGILFAADDENPAVSDFFWFSRIENVRIELDGFETVDSGPGGVESRVTGDMERLGERR